LEVIESCPGKIVFDYLPNRVKGSKTFLKKLFNSDKCHEGNIFNSIAIEDFLAGELEKDSKFILEIVHILLKK
jgi:hypothetical protein